MEEAGLFTRHCQLRFGIPMEQGPELMVVRGPKPALLSPALWAQGPAAHTTTARSLQALSCHHALHHLPGVTGSTGRAWHLRPVGAELFLCELFVCGVCLCVCEGWAVAGGQKWSLGYGGREGFLSFCIFVIREKTNFYGYFYGWYVPRTWSIYFTNSPLPVPWGY